MPEPASPPLLRMRNISKSFPGVRALNDVDIDVHSGEVVAIIGENGAGKSTLIKTLGGAHLADSGSIEIEGQSLDLDTPHLAQQAGIGVIYQEFNLVRFLSARENIFLGHARQRMGLIDAGSERRTAMEMFDKLGMQIDPEIPVAKLSIAEQQIVEIAKSLITNVKILVMDEPTATLTSNEVRKLFDVVRELKSQGIGIIYISHRLDEVLDIADRVIVLRDGEKIAERPISETSRREMIELMVGRTIENEFPKHHHHPGEIRLAVHELSWSNKVDKVSFDVRAGEVLGITGLVGAGRTEVAQLIAGYVPPDSGTIVVDGQAIELTSPRSAIRAGICLLSEDRKGQGLVLGHNVQENFGLPNLDHFSRVGVMNVATEASALANFVDSLQIKAASHRQLAGQLSGGNQQKLVLAKWLERDCNIMIIDEPTRGIDVGAKYEIYLLINQLAEQGKAVIMISSELPEILGMADRVLVMRQGQIRGEITDPAAATQEQVMELAAH